MFNLIRRISGSVIPRPDRPWRDDATSNAPVAGRKRRLSLTERDDEPLSVKRTKGDTKPVADDADDTSRRGDSPAVTVPPGKETEDVKEVTKGVKEVELDGEKPSSISSESQDSTATPPPETQAATESQETVEEVVPETPPVEEPSSTNAVEDSEDATISKVSDEDTYTPAPPSSDALVSSEVVPEEKSEVSTPEKPVSDHTEVSQATGNTATLEKSSDSAEERNDED